VWGVGLGGEAAPPYWHWTQVVQSLARRREGGEVLDRLGRSAGWLRALVPDLEIEPPPRAESATADERRFRIYDALLALLAGAGERFGLLVVLDDLHLADRASLLALAFIGRAIADQRVLIVGTERELEPAAAGQQQPAPSIERLMSLQGLAPAQVGEMIEVRRGAPPPDDVVSRIHEQTGGNPLFVLELLRLLESGVRPSAELPAGITETITARLAPLSVDQREVLDVACVIGTRFRVDTLVRVMSIPTVDLLERLDGTVRLRILRPLSDPGGQFAFSHGLVQAALYDHLPRRRRLELHAMIGDALREREQAVGEGLAEVAYHYLEAAPADPDRAVHFARRAAERAVEDGAYDQAVGLYRRALELGDPRGKERLELLQSLGEAQMRSGDTDGARATLMQAAAAARAAGDRAAFGRAVLACGIWGLTFGFDEELVGLAEEAVSLLDGSGELGLLARAKGFLAVAIYWSPQRERCEQLATEALDLARSEHRRVNDPGSARTLAYVLGRYLLARWGPQSAVRDLAASDELLDLSRQLHDGELELLCRNWRIAVLLELGRVAAVDDEIARVEDMANRLRQPRAMGFLPLHRALREAMVGRFVRAEEYNAESAEIGRRVPGSVAELAGTAQLIGLRIQQGRTPELEAPIRHGASAHPELVALRCALAMLLIQAGRPAEARTELEQLMAHGRAAFPVDCTTLVMLALAGEVAAELADVERSRAVYEALAPFSGRWLVSAGACAIWPVDRSLGRLAALTGEYERALVHLEQAREQSERVGAIPAMAFTALDSARALLGRNRPGDEDRALALAHEARTLAQDVGMALVVDAAALLEGDREPQTRAH
jgi:tetratricopeptide (TPR) repeat protein